MHKPRQAAARHGRRRLSVCWMKKKKGLSGEALRRQSLQIRSGFIRETHHTRSEQSVKNLKRFAESDLGGRWGEQ